MENLNWKTGAGWCIRIEIKKQADRETENTKKIADSGSIWQFIVVL